jgi:hypothetical protein
MQEKQQSPKKKIKRKKNNSDGSPTPSGGIYFDQKVEDAIVEFQRELDTEKKKEIFATRIRPALMKLVENIIFVYKFNSIGDISILKNDCVSFLFEILHKFDATRGHKAFSYFNVTAKNWFIQRAKTFQKTKSDVNLDSALIKKLEKTDDTLSHDYESKLIETEFNILISEEVKKWRSKVVKKQERMVLEAIILLLSNPELVPIYNKKGIFLYIKEITGCTTKQVATNLNRIRKRYDSFRKRYLNGEV